MLPNPRQPTIGPAQRAMPSGVCSGRCDGLPILGSAAMKSFQEGSDLVVDGIVGPLT
jgi:hypothetical protein